MRVIFEVKNELYLSLLFGAVGWVGTSFRIVGDFRWLMPLLLGLLAFFCAINSLRAKKRMAQIEVFLAVGALANSIILSIWAFFSWGGFPGLA